MEKRIIIIDGYNAIHRLPKLRSALSKSIEAGRTALLQLCAEWLSTRRDVYMFYVVFDGDSSVTEEGRQFAKNVRTVYTRTDEKADDRILDIIKERGADSCEFTVVSDDNYVRRNSKEMNATIMPVEEFYGTITRKRSATLRNVQSSGDKTGLSSFQKKAINDELKEVWKL